MGVILTIIGVILMVIIGILIRKATKSNYVYTESPYGPGEWDECPVCGGHDMVAIGGPFNRKLRRIRNTNSISHSNNPIDRTGRAIKRASRVHESSTPTWDCISCRGRGVVPRNSA